MYAICLCTSFIFYPGNASIALKKNLEYFWVTLLPRSKIDDANIPTHRDKKKKELKYIYQKKEKHAHTQNPFKKVRKEEL